MMKRTAGLFLGIALVVGGTVGDAIANPGVHAERQTCTRISTVVRTKPRRIDLSYLSILRVLAGANVATAGTPLTVVHRTVHVRQVVRCSMVVTSTTLYSTPQIV
ncbi:MAG: hypothetical protein NVS2B16_17580 [Chloroflexota bacterium]